MSITVTAELLDGKKDIPADSIRPDTFLQSDFWTSFKTSHGWQRLNILLTVADGITIHTMMMYVLIRSFKKLFTLAYVPLAPRLSAVVPEHESAVLVKTAAAVKPLLPSGTVMIRFDPPEYTSHSAEETSVFPQIYKTGRTAGVYRSTSDVQPPDSVILDLTKPAEEILAEMKQKWRYNIRLAEKKGVQVTFYTGREAVTHIDEFYALYGETSERDGIAVHAKSYYADLLNCGTQSKSEVRLYIARHEKDNLAAIITLFCTTPDGTKEAVYLYGASSNTKRNLMPAYSLQWKAIQDAKNAGCIRYDFYGIPPVNDENHPMYGLYRFKTGFGGLVIHRSGSLDVPLKTAIYRLFRLAEKARAFWFKRVKKLFVTKKVA